MHTTFKDTGRDNIIFVHILKSSWKLDRILAYNHGGGGGGWRMRNIVVGGSDPILFLLE